MRRALLLLGLGLWLGCSCVRAASNVPGELRLGQGGREFPIAVWLQEPVLAERYRKLGINLYVGLWKGPTAQQLATLRRYGMPVIAAQNPLALAEQGDSVVIGWLQKDEPDNAQPVLGRLPGLRALWGAPIPPVAMQVSYRDLRAKDETRPVMLNLGKGVAWDAWRGRGERTAHPEDYAEYCKAADIVSFDIYPAQDDEKAVKGRLELVAEGVRRLRRWCGQDKTVWNFIGAARIDDSAVAARIAEIRAQVWMSVISGSRGIVYFVHRFKPTFAAASWLEDASLASGIQAINSELQGLAPVVLAGTDEPLAAVTAIPGAAASAASEMAIAVMQRKFACRPYVLVASLRPRAQRVRIAPVGAVSAYRLEELHSRQHLESVDGAVETELEPYGIGLYRGERLPGCRST